MYHFPGEYVTDFCIVQRAGIYHLFHIRGERWTWPVGYRELVFGPRNFDRSVHLDPACASAASRPRWRMG